MKSKVHKVKVSTFKFPEKKETIGYNFMFLSCHVHVSEWIHTL